MKKIVSSIAASALLATGLFAQNTEIANAAGAATEVSIAADKTGQFLIAPAYFATNGYTTKLKVINTDTDSSVLLRAVIRDAVCSQEVDFPILLSPGDMWEGEIYAEGGKVYIKSTDDSSSYLPQLADGIDIAQASRTAYTFESGYVEFYPVAQFNEDGDNVGENLTADEKRKRPAVSKDVLKTRFQDFVAKNVIAAGTALVDNSIAQQVDNDALAGFVTLQKDDDAAKVSMTLPMMAFEDVQLANGTLPGAAASLSRNTVPNNFINQAVVYNALRVDNVIVPYTENGANNIELLTFWNDQLCPQSRSFAVDVRDMQENVFEYTSPESFSVPNELGVIAVKQNIMDEIYATYDTGWVNFVNFRQLPVTVPIANGRTSNQSADTDEQGLGRERPAMIPTQMTANKLPSGTWTTNWVYSPFER